jgi:hypothetical protein
MPLRPSLTVTAHSTVPMLHAAPVPTHRNSTTRRVVRGGRCR